MSRASKLAKRLALLCVAFCACGSIAWDDTPSPSENSVTSLNYTQEADKTVLEIGVTNEPTFSVYTLNNPSRVVVEILDCDTTQKISPLSVRNGVVDSAALSVSKSNHYQTCRVILSLDHDAEYTVDSSSGRILLSVNGAPTMGDAALDSYIAKAKTSDAALAQAQSVIAREQAARDAADARAAAAEARADAALADANDAKARAAAAEARANAALSDANQALMREQNALAELNAAKAEAQNRIAAANAEANQARATAQALEAVAANDHNISTTQLAQAKEKLAKAERELAQVQNEMKLLDTARAEAISRANAAEARANAAFADATRANDRATAADHRATAAERRAAEAAAQTSAAIEREQRAVAELNLAQIQAQERIHAAFAEAEAARAAEQVLARNAETDHQSNARELSAARAQLAKAETELANARREMAELNQAKTDALAREQEALAKLDQAQDSARKRIQEAVAEAEAARAAEQALARNAETDHETNARELSAARAQLAKAETELASAQSELQQLNKARSEALAREQQAIAQRDAANARANASDSAYASLSAQNAELRSKLSSQESEMARLEAEIQKASAAKRQIKKLENAALTDSKAIAKRDAQIAELERQVKTGRTAQKQLEALKAENEQLRAQAAKAREVPIDHQVGNMAQESVQVATTAPLDLSVPNTSVQDIQFRDQGDNMQVIVKLSSPASKVENMDIGNQRSVLRISDASLPDGFNKKFDTSAFRKGVRFVDSTENNGNIELIAQSTSRTVESVEQNGDTIIWNLRTLPGTYQSYATPIDRRANAMVSASGNDGELAATYGKRNTLADTPFAKRKITLDIRDGEVTDLLRLLSDEINVSIVVSPDVKGRVTLSLKSVPLDQALDLILRMNDLGMKYEGNIIWVAKAETFRAEEERALKAAEVREKLEPLEVRLVPVNYATADDLSANVKSLLSSRGTVNIDKRTNTLILKDVAANLDAAEILVTNLDTQTPQILIEARIVETQANFTKQIGVQWGGDGIASAATGNATGIVFPSTIGVAGGSTSENNAGTSATPNFAVNLPASVGTGAGGAIGFTFGSIGGAINLNLRLSAMEDKGFLKIVSAPRIMTLDNIQASIESGTSIPISVVSAAGAQTVFYDAKLNLQVTPHVTRDGNVYLKIDISKNEPDFGNTGASGDPSIIRKQAHTELLIPDGDTTVIGGIYTRNASQSMSSVPFFGSIPILGYLFRSTSETDNRTELLIFITPRIINRDASIAASGPGSFIPPEEKESKK